MLNAEESELVEVALKTLRVTKFKLLALSTDCSEGKMLVSCVGNNITNDPNVDVSFSLCYVGKYWLDNGLDESNLADAGSLIAVRVSFFDRSSENTEESRTIYALYKGEKISVFDGRGSEVTIGPKKRLGAEG